MEPTYVNDKATLGQIFPVDYSCVRTEKEKNGRRVFPHVIDAGFVSKVQRGNLTCDLHHTKSGAVNEQLTSATVLSNVIEGYHCGRAK